MIESGHRSVLVNETLSYLALKPNGVYLDATFGAGGHTRAILEAEPTAIVVGVDWDHTSLEQYGEVIQREFGDRFIPLWGNFAHLYKLIKSIDVEKFDGILADFGTSQMQIRERAGFSFNVDTSLDMRMSPAHQKETAAHIVNTYPADRLVRIFKDYSEERFAGPIARAIVDRRGQREFSTTKDLAQLIEKVIPAAMRAKMNIHPATRVFQALRIYVNEELKNIETFLKSAVPLLAVHGRLVCISFHSLEDRIVKRFFQEQARMGRLQIITRQPVMASDEEVLENPSARSAKLRAAEKLVL